MILALEGGKRQRQAENPCVPVVSVSIKKEVWRSFRFRRDGIRGGELGESADSTHATGNSRDLDLPPTENRLTDVNGYVTYFQARPGEDGCELGEAGEYFIAWPARLIDDDPSF